MLILKLPIKLDFAEVAHFVINLFTFLLGVREMVLVTEFHQVVFVSVRKLGYI